MQALYLLALEPVSETTADSNSYGFRKERSTGDAREQCFCVLAKKVSPEWIMEGDIKGCFDHINEWLLNNIPMDKVMLRKWLKCGFVFNKELFPHGRGYSTGRYHFTNSCEYNTGRTANYACREVSQEICKQENDLLSQSTSCSYADDFIITGRSNFGRNQTVSSGLSQRRGLTLSEEKTRLHTLMTDLTFLGTISKIQRSTSN